MCRCTSKSSKFNVPFQRGENGRLSNRECKDISQLNLQTMKMVMFSSFNFSWKINSN